ncbi:MAG: MBL fold metallo-hydrolase [Kiritimatiellae bacterium]|nr:MBL fold metallo-hydrolase [Kiritimatiellia bacterium]
MLEKRIIPVGPFAANCIVLWGEERKAWIIDPGADADIIESFLGSKNLIPCLAAYTHGHFDHVNASIALAKRWPSLAFHVGRGDEPMLGHPANCWPPDYVPMPRPANLVCDLQEGSVLEGGGINAHILHTPGHTPGGVCFHFEEDKLLLTGDTLFAGSCGRTDFPGGSMKQLQNSLARLKTLPPETEVVAGHGLPTTIGREIAQNPYLQGEGAFYE